MNERNAIQTILNHLQEQHQQYVQLLELAEQQKQAIDDNANELVERFICSSPSSMAVSKASSGWRRFSSVRLMITGT